MSPLRRLPDPGDLDRDDVVELIDVPAAVVCMVCGSSDCPGCIEEEVRTQSGVVVFVPWERPQLGLWNRFWQTTRATTQGAEAFFAGIPEGPVQPALTYAIIAETVAVATSAAVLSGFLGGLVYLALPKFAAWALQQPLVRHALARVFVAGVISFTAVLIAAHARHGLALHRAATAAGKSGDPRRAIRFGLYAAGWDVVTSPFGVVAILFTQGPRALSQVLDHAVHTPGRATDAMLRGLYALSGMDAKSVKRRAMIPTMGFSVAAVVVALALVVVAAAT